MVPKIDSCRTCSVYNQVIRDSLNYIYRCNLTGLWGWEFSLDRMIECPMDDGTYKAVKDICPNCENVSLYYKDLLSDVRRRVLIIKENADSKPDNIKSHALLLGIRDWEKFLDDNEKYRKYFVPRGWTFRRI